MGTINYKTSDIITLGIKDYNDDYYFWNDYNIAKDIIDDYMFYGLKVKIELGYYNGFSIDIINDDYKTYDNDYCFTDHEQKIDFLKELTELKKLLIELVKKAALLVCYPSWCTGFKNYKDSIQEITNAIKSEKELAKKGCTAKTMTKYDFEKATGINVILKGSYNDKKSQLRDIAINFQCSEKSFSCYDLLMINYFFTEYGKRYGLITEFRENGII